jgi:uncharacterized protein (DUF488 family)
MENEVSSAGAAGTAQIFTIGHSTRTIEEFVGMLKAYGVTCLADIRTVPRSRTNPQFNKDALPDSLELHGIKYTHIAGLGGLRKTSADSVNKGWRNDSFRGYADYMQTPEFEESLNALIELMGRETVAIMCAEAVPWRCHRSLVADALTVRGFNAEDIMSVTKSEPHKIRSFAKVEGTKITYPPVDEE